MQEEVTGKSVALIIDGAKMSEQVLEKALQKFLEAQKNKSPKMHRGKQTLKQLAGQSAGLADILYKYVFTTHKACKLKLHTRQFNVAGDKVHSFFVVMDSVSFRHLLIVNNASHYISK